MASEKGTWPENVGILAMEIYFPSQYVDQEELEAFDGVSAGKYTIGLGQKRMGFCSDLEDINSLCMTVVHNLMQKTGTGLRSSHMQHAYDFYKPDLSSEYPVVDGRLSIQSYLGALDQCYRRYRQKAAARPGGSPVTVDSFDAVLFHSPFGKLVQKSLARLVFNDFLQADDATVAEKYPGLEELRGKTLEESYFDRDVEKAFMERSRDQFEKKTRPSLLLASNVGNMYTPSLYSCLVSLLVSKKPDELTGTRIALFSYGSGLASSLFSIRVATSNGSGSRLEALLACVSDVMSRLESRQKVPPQVFADTMKLREESHHLAPYQPKGDPSVLFPGTYYLTGIDEKHRRQYSRAT
ncbi:Hydroxymethylglutaryl-CoA synthase 1 [Amphibalanus amphitrite]|uniref:Hydroxymethylglutaryl-CoA synthase n=1 Tax=Amphibalanus amphitrite TaxID=1232801 RepID=A0A6A4WJE0_AMPAM|nr:Hydroxymethylglutaryl-CoA synthase 1 [Amphibalanus amphitrite]